jgi:predicted amidohydrolase
VRVALMQLHVSSEETMAQRWERAERMLSQLIGQSVDLIVLPELWRVGFSNFAQYREAAEPLQGETQLRLARWARTLNAHIVTGSFIEKQAEQLYNTTMLLDNNGTCMGSYRKIHLFGYDSQEQQLLTAGDTTSEIQTPYGVFGLATCYDLRFPEQFRRMVSQGTQAFLICAAWPKVRIEDWELFCRARALENQSFLLACNTCGTWNGEEGGGHSVIVSPEGRILAQAGEAEELVLADIDLQEVEHFRARFPALHDRVCMY